MNVIKKIKLLSQSLSLIAVKLLISCSAFFVLLPGSNLHAAIDQPARTLSEFEQPTPEKVIRVKNVKVVIADYDLIRRDFPQTRKLSEAQIDSWLVEKTGYVSVTQALQTEVNTQIETLPEERRAYRPFGYNRALVFNVGKNQYIDAKGVGTKNPSSKHHSNGLGTVAEMLREFMFEKKVQQILTDAKQPNQTVGNYAVLDLGFDVVYNKSPEYFLTDLKYPAGVLLRQAHQRYTEKYLRQLGNNFLSKAVSRKLELIFRKYGLTSSAEGDRKPFKEGLPIRNVINIQGNRQGQLVDFGTYRGRSLFQRDTFWYPEKETADATPLIRTSDADFILKPDPALALSNDIWGQVQTADGKEYEALRHELHQLVTDYRNNNSKVSFIKAIRNYVSDRINQPQIKIQNSQSASTKKIGFFSGTFDPPHLGHLEILKKAIDELHLDIVYVLPNISPSHKPNATDNDLRLQMTKRAFAKIPQVIVAEPEHMDILKENGVIKLLNHLAKKFSNSTVYQIMGDDALERLSPEIFANYAKNILVAVSPRMQGIESAQAMATENSRVLVLSGNVVEYSSTLYRSQIQKGLVPEQVDQGVMDLIQKHHLYSSGPAKICADLFMNEAG